MLSRFRIDLQERTFSGKSNAIEKGAILCDSAHGASVVDSKCSLC